MEKRRTKFKTIDEYISLFPKDVQKSLERIRQIIKKTAPRAEETISYRMPTFKLHRNLVHFAAFKGHIGFFPTSSGVAAFKKELSQYTTTKGTIRFSLDKPIPLDLVKKIVKFRVQEELDKIKNKGKQKIRALKKAGSKSVI